MRERTESNAGEWADQERAVSDERIGAATADLDPRVAQYRLIARVLREPVEEALPPGFAAMVSARSEAASRVADDKRELWTQWALFALFVVGALAGFAGDLVALVRSIVVSAGADGPAEPVRWAAAIGACLALTLLVEIRAALIRTRTL